MADETGPRRRPSDGNGVSGSDGTDPTGRDATGHDSTGSDATGGRASDGEAASAPRRGLQRAQTPTPRPQRADQP